MLPTGHLAAGYLTTKIVLASLQTYYPQSGESSYLIAGIIASVLPDVDVLFFFLQSRGLTSGTKNGVNHRMYLTHTPALHLLIAALGWCAGHFMGSSTLELFFLMYLVGTWTHFIFDSFFYGIKWTWPYSHRLYAVSSAGKDFLIESSGTADFWKKFAILYAKNYVFYLELLVIALAIFVAVT